MKPTPFDYVAPNSVEEALRILDGAGGGATILAGGQTLMPLLNLRMNQPFILVDINKIEGMHGVALVDEGIRVGAATKQVDALNDAILQQHLPVFVQALSYVGHHQTRNRGTIGGSIALGEPAAEMPATAVALGAKMEIASLRGTRMVPAREFYLGPYMTVLEPDEIVTAIIYPKWPVRHHILFKEVAQRPGDFALVGLVGAGCVEDGKVSRIGLSWFGMGPTPIPMTQVEARLINQRLADVDIRDLAKVSIEETAPFSDHHASAEYRRTVGNRLFVKTLQDAFGLKEVV